MDEERFLIIKNKIRNSYIEQKKYKMSRQVVVIQNNSVFPEKTEKISGMVKKIDDLFIKDVLGEDYIEYKKGLIKSNMTIIKKLSIEYEIDLAKLNGYSKYVCDTKDQYIKSLIEKVFILYK